MKNRFEDKMKFKLRKVNVSIPIKNYDIIIGNGKITKRHGKGFPNTIRGAICGPSNCGKTYIMVTMLDELNGIRYENIYTYSKSLDQPIYDYLRMVIGGIQDLQESKDDMQKILLKQYKDLIEPMENIKYFEFSEQEQVKSPEEVLPDSVMIFDDIALEKQDSVKEFYTRGRHKHVDSFYLAQSYSGVPKHYVRDNLNFIIAFRQDELNLKHLYNNHVNTDMTFDEFKEMCHECWKDKHGYIIIDKESDINNGRYRKGFSETFFINDETM